MSKKRKPTKIVIEKFPDDDPDFIEILVGGDDAAFELTAEEEALLDAEDDE